MFVSTYDSTFIGTPSITATLGLAIITPTTVRPEPIFITGIPDGTFPPPDDEDYDDVSDDEDFIDRTVSLNDPIATKTYTIQYDTIDIPDDFDEPTPASTLYKEGEYKISNYKEHINHAARKIRQKVKNPMKGLPVQSKTQYIDIGPTLTTEYLDGVSMYSKPTPPPREHHTTKQRLRKLFWNRDFALFRTKWLANVRKLARKWALYGTKVAFKHAVAHLLNAFDRFTQSQDPEELAAIQALVQESTDNHEIQDFFVDFEKGYGFESLIKEDNLHKDAYSSVVYNGAEVSIDDEGSFPNLVHALMVYKRRIIMYTTGDQGEDDVKYELVVEMQFNPETGDLNTDYQLFDSDGDVIHESESDKAAGLYTDKDFSDYSDLL